MADKPDISMLHPALADISESDFRSRTGFFSRLFFWKMSEWINWYGDIRKYCTADQYAQYIRDNPPAQSDITIGPR